MSKPVPYFEAIFKALLNSTIELYNIMRITRPTDAPIMFNVFDRLNNV